VTGGSLDVLQRLVSRGIPGRRIVDARPLAEGFTNHNYVVRLDGLDDAFVLRVYRADASACVRELQILTRLAATVPVPVVVHAEPGGDDGNAFLLLRHVAGITFRQLRRTGDAAALQEAAHSVGESLAVIGRQPGEPACRRDPLDDAVLTSPVLRERVGGRLHDALLSYVASWRPRLAILRSQRDLIHGDFNKRNVLVRAVRGRWRVAAIVDWECAGAGTPLVDVGIFLRYERAQQPVAEPGFSRGYVDAGGFLPEDWMDLARAVDLSSLCGILAQDHVPADVVAEVRDLVLATLDA
jgi:aminoglycoside phosphotransferase (APT) family kinase protein